MCDTNRFAGGFLPDVPVVLEKSPRLVPCSAAVPAAKHQGRVTLAGHVHRSRFATASPAERVQVWKREEVTVVSPRAHEAGRSDQHITVGRVAAHHGCSAVDCRPVCVDDADGSGGVRNDDVAPVVREQQSAALNAVLVQVQRRDRRAVKGGVDVGELVAGSQVHVDWNPGVRFGARLRRPQLPRRHPARRGTRA